MTYTQKFVAIPALAILALGGGVALSYAQLSEADTDDMQRMGMMRGHGVHGEITQIDGDTITLEGKNGTTYTIDASDAEVRKFTEGEGLDEVSLDALTVGDTIGVRGEVDGTAVVATNIMSGAPGKGMMHGRGGHGIMGEVIAVDGSTITVKNQNGESYTVDAGDATISRMVEGTLSDIQVGDRIGAHGTVDGTTVDALHIMDDMKEFKVND